MLSLIAVDPPLIINQGSMLKAMDVDPPTTIASPPPSPSPSPSPGHAESAPTELTPILSERLMIHLPHCNVVRVTRSTSRSTRATQPSLQAPPMDHSQSAPVDKMYDDDGYTSLADIPRLWVTTVPPRK